MVSGVKTTNVFKRSTKEILTLNVVLVWEHYAYYTHANKPTY